MYIATKTVEAIPASAVTNVPLALSHSEVMTPPAANGRARSPLPPPSQTTILVGVVFSPKDVIHDRCASANDGIITWRYTVSVT
jgi:hypothetical protein